jgi:hypothetical protein
MLNDTSNQGQQPQPFSASDLDGLFAFTSYGDDSLPELPPPDLEFWDSYTTAEEYPLSGHSDPSLLQSAYLNEQVADRDMKAELQDLKDINFSLQQRLDGLDIICLHLRQQYEPT